jgi:hypothetical protein
MRNEERVRLEMGWGCTKKWALAYREMGCDLCMVHKQGLCTITGSVTTNIILPFITQFPQTRTQVCRET